MTWKFGTIIVLNTVPKPIDLVQKVKGQGTGSSFWTKLSIVFQNYENYVNNTKLQYNV